LFEFDGRKEQVNVHANLRAKERGKIKRKKGGVD
jgi:hypothetical protein